MPTLSERTRSRKEHHKPLQWVDVSGWILRIYVLLMIAGLPWYYGCATWTGQYYMFVSSIGLAAAIGIHCIAGWLSSSKGLSIPWGTWVLFGLATFAFAQTLPVFRWQGNAAFPPSVPLQRWALGLTNSPAAIQSWLLTDDLSSHEKSSDHISIPCDLKGIAESDQTLAWSVEPLHTQGAFPSLILCGLLIWAGRMVFAESKKQLWLFVALAVVGTAVSCAGIQGSISYRSENFLGLKTGSSFATFVSKNSAGGYFNICIAGCLGLLGWTLLNTRRKRTDMRYRFPDSSLLLKIRGALEDVLADLNTPQIAAMLALVTVVAALLISLCRGAAVSAIAATIAASVIANARNQSKGSWVISVAVLIGCIACLIGFQLDEQAYSRIESLSEIDFENEIRAGRAYIWSIAWKAMQYYGWAGSGLGTFHFSYLPFQQPSASSWFYHAENLYAQCGVELGFLGLIVMCLSVLFMLWEVQRDIPNENWRYAFPAKLAGSYLVISQALHSCVDFALILPALYVPACLLLGSVEGVLKNASKLPPTKKDASRLATVNPAKSESITVQPTKSSKSQGPLPAFMGAIAALCCGLAFYFSLGTVRSLALAEEMDYWTRTEDKKPLTEQTPDRIRDLASMWAKDKCDIRENSMAMMSFADGLVYDYRMDQLVTLPPSGAWKQAWGATSPFLLQVTLRSEKNPRNRELLMEAVGGSKAMSKLSRSAEWYAKGHIRSPLNWRLAWGRCLANFNCDQNNMKSLLHVNNQIGRHNASQLLLGTVLFSEQLDFKQKRLLWSQAMKTSIGIAQNAANLIATEVKDADVPLEVFPQRYDILEALAKQPFKKETFPVSHRALWERAIALIAKANVSSSRRELWLADANLAIGNRDEEIAHLRAAARFEPNNIKLICRLGMRLLDAGDIPSAQAQLKQAQRLDPTHSDIKTLAAKLQELER